MGIIARCVAAALSAVAAVASGVESTVSSGSIANRPLLPGANKFTGLGFGTGSSGAPPRSTIVKSGKIDALRKRIKSVGNSQKITTAMKLVAAAKVRRAQDAVLCGRPFSESLEKMMRNLLDKLKLEDVDSPVLTQRPVKKVTLMVITGDKGLCGGYNSFIIKKTEQRVKQLKSLGIPVDLVTVGIKGGAYFKRREYDIEAEYPCPVRPSSDFSNGISEKLLAKYLSGETDRIEIISAKFISLVSNEPQISILLPRNQYELAEELGEKAPDEDGDGASLDNTIFEQEPVTMLDSLMPLYFNSQILRRIQDAVASELAARMTAMSAASDNAKALKKGLTLEMNRARQAEVTQGILEIVGGAAAS
jgi:F-type H+-transporting ATPase subunit gamma